MQRMILHGNGESQIICGPGRACLSFYSHLLLQGSGKSQPNFSCGEIMLQPFATTANEAVPQPQASWENVDAAAKCGLHGQEESRMGALLGLETSTASYGGWQSQLPKVASAKARGSSEKMP